MANKRLNRLSSIPDAFIEKLSPIQRAIFEKLLAKLSGLKTVDGFIDRTLGNQRIVDEIRTFIHDELLKTNYPKAVKDFADEFSVQSELTKSYYSAAFETTFSTALADASVKQIKKSVVQALITDSVQAGFLSPLENVLSVAVNSGASFVETVKNIRDFVEGNENVDGAILKYSKQLAHDSFANSDRAYNSAIADELEIEWFLWAGGEIATSRCFCIERHGKYYHYKEIEKWGRKEDIGECNIGDGWAGMNRSTDEKTIFTYAGGYGCLHTVAGVSIFDVPKEDVVRNIENGNYEPGRTEAEFFGL